MANLPADLPTNWTQGQIISPNGTEVGLTEQYGYNYLNEQVNDTQTEVNSLSTAQTNTQQQVNTLNTQVGNIQGQVTTQGQSITSLQETTTSQGQSITSLQSQVSSNDTDISNLQNTTTTQGQSISALETEVDELKNSVSDGKTLVANAITEKGVTTAADATFQIMADNIASIPIVKLETGTFTPTANNISYTVQLSTDFIPDYIFLMPIANPSSLTIYGIVSLNYDRSTDTWVILCRRSGSDSSFFFYGADEYASGVVGDEFVYDVSAGSITVTGASSPSPRYPFLANVTYKWVMWKE